MADRIKPCTIVVALGLLAASTGPGKADAIDGEWCDNIGHHFTINGPDIVTPEGTRTTGDYSRHAFSYKNPQTDAAGEGQIFLRLLNETTVNLRHGTNPAGPVQVWKRCQPVS